MNTTIINPALQSNYTTNTKTGVVTRFLNWCEDQEQNRFMWLGLALAVFGCILTPIAVMIIAMTGVNIFLIGATAFAMAFVLIANLAAMPTKITIPTFFLGVLIDVVVIALAFSGV